MSIKVVRNFTVVEDVYNDFRYICRRKGRSVSTSLEDLIIKYLKMAEDTLDQIPRK